MTRWEQVTTVGQLVAQRPLAARVFERYGIDFCCGGNVSLEQACRAQGLEPERVLDEVARCIAQPGDDLTDWTERSLSELCDHIESTHHAYLREELQPLAAMIAKVASRHGESDPRLDKVVAAFSDLQMELMPHMMKEEQILFPMIRQLECGAEQPHFHCGNLRNPVGMMEMEHDHAGRLLKSIRDLTDDYAAPDWACNTYRAMLERLARLESDMHRHVFKENEILFPRAVALQDQLASS